MRSSISSPILFTSPINAVCLLSARVIKIYPPPPLRLSILYPASGVNLDVMWTPKDNYNDKLNLILAGGGEDMPQIIATETKSPAIINAAKAGALWDIEELLQSEEFTYAKSEAVSDETGKDYVEFTL